MKVGRFTITYTTKKVLLKEAGRVLHAWPAHNEQARVKAYLKAMDIAKAKRNDLKTKS